MMTAEAAVMRTLKEEEKNVRQKYQQLYAQLELNAAISEDSTAQQINESSEQPCK